MSIEHFSVGEHILAATGPVTEVADRFRKLVRDKHSVVYILGLRGHLEYAPWLQAHTVPTDPVFETRLRAATQLAEMVWDDRRPWMSRTWLICHNPYLDERAPAELIGQLDGSEHDAEIASQLSLAADAFVASSREEKITL